MNNITLRDVWVSVVSITAVVLLHVAWNRLHTPRFETPYQAVLLTNNNVYIGKIENLGSNFPILRDVFFIQTKVNPDTKQAMNTLLKRQSAWHEPAYMVLDERQIVSIEPVGANSKVAELINENSGGSKK